MRIHGQDESAALMSNVGLLVSAGSRTTMALKHEKVSPLFVFLQFSYQTQIQLILEYFLSNSLELCVGRCRKCKLPLKTKEKQQ